MGSLCPIPTLAILNPFPTEEDSPIYQGMEPTHVSELPHFPILYSSCSDVPCETTGEAGSTKLRTHPTAGLGALVPNHSVMLDRSEAFWPSHVFPPSPFWLSPLVFFLLPQCGDALTLPSYTVIISPKISYPS